MRIPVILLLAVTALSVARALTPPPQSVARALPIASDAYAASSANVTAAQQSTLITDGRDQFAAFYRTDGRVVVARRTIGEDVWTTTVTSLTGEPADAHRTIALGIDGQGRLHVVWNQHGDALHYVCSASRHGTDFAPATMLGTKEAEVTYPIFLRLPDGNLLFTYRDGKSGQGDFVLNQFDSNKAAWSRVHDTLLSGEGQRSAYPNFHLDARGTLHLAWVWRETPDVATNHDLGYARSRDGGRSWETVDGRPLALPLSYSNSEYAVHIPERSNLMNPPSITADNAGRPLIANYWSDQPGAIPQMRLVRHDGKGWQVIQVSRRQGNFTLEGMSTKRPPLSRPIVVVRNLWRQPAEAVVVYRDDERGSRAVLAHCANLDAPQVEWTLQDLTAGSVGAWEPSFDLMQWRRLDQLHLLVQEVDQRDGNDSAVAPRGSEISTLLWSPFLQGHANRRAGRPVVELPPPPAGELETPVSPAATLDVLLRATRWQLSQEYKRDPRGWEIAPFYIGAWEVSKLAPDSEIEGALRAIHAKSGWTPAPRDYHADDYAVVQAYAEAYRKSGDKAELAPSLALFDRLLAKPATTPLDWGVRGALDRWSWCDALFMGPASFLDAFAVTRDPRLLETMNHEWWLTTDTLYIPADGFYARDESFLDLREPNGRRLYWARGNGWVAAGLARTLDRLPVDYAERPRYVELYRRMMDAVLSSQQPDGLWRPGLLDAAAHPARESSGSAFFTFALAWGVNRGLLDRDRVEPAVRRAWNALRTHVRENGKVEYIQPIGAAPEGFDPTHTDAYGVGAFLLAGTEVYRLVAPAPKP